MAACGPTFPPQYWKTAACQSPGAPFAQRSFAAANKASSALYGLGTSPFTDTSYSVKVAGKNCIGPSAPA